MISIHAPAKGATGVISEWSRDNQFQSTLPRRERRYTRFTQDKAVDDFNPRSREGSDILLYCKEVCLWISIHAPAKGATAYLEQYTDFAVISIHAPAKGATIVASDSKSATIISIHAPAKGATLELDKLKSYSRISIHAPAKGATGARAYLVSPRRDFNPRSREGSDRIGGHTTTKATTISIHAPAKGATPFLRCKIAVFAFQSTLPRRERLQSLKNSLATLGFQSTLPRRERL